MSSNPAKGLGITCYFNSISSLSLPDVTIAVLIEDPESFLNLLLGVRVLHLARHHGEKLGEIDCPVTVGINLVDHILKFGLRRVLSQRSHHRSKFLITMKIVLCFHIIFGIHDHPRGFRALAKIWGRAIIRKH